MTPVSERKKLQRELAEHLREKDTAALRLLRAQIGAARVERRSRLIRARMQCRTARESLKERQAAERARLLTEHRDQRAKGKTVCELGKEQAKREGLALEHGAKRTLKEERLYQRRIREAGKPVKVRTEAFLEWAEENPEEILAVQETQAEQYLRGLLKQQRELGRNVRKAGRYKQTPEELEQLLSAVPF